jgi:diguanylate cyclase (GGDEF)-like protein/PAS domain S-box-containing protein
VAAEIGMIAVVGSGETSQDVLLILSAATAAITCLSLVLLWRMASRGRAELLIDLDRLASLVERSTDIIVVVDRNGRVAYTSGAVAVVLGVDSQTWTGRNLDELDLDPASEPWTATSQRVQALRPDETLAIELTAPHSNGTHRLLEMTAINLAHNPAIGGVVLSLRDVTSNRRLERQMTFRSDHDQLTGLANRARFLERLSGDLGHGSRPMVIFIDLDGFKAINDSVGHQAGDVLLRTIGHRLSAHVPATVGLLARLGGDEFAVLLSDASIDTAVSLAQAIVADVEKSVMLSRMHTVNLSCSVGIAVADEGDSASAVLRHADLAMYRAKRRGTGFIEVFDAAIGEEASRTDSFRRDLGVALERGQFELVYQPIVTVGEARIVGAEALIRWNHPEHGAVRPGDFIELAEQSGLIVPIGWWSIEQACATAVGWPDQTLFVTVNLSGRQLRGAGIVDQVRGALEQTGLDPNRLVLELTERMLHDGPDEAVEELAALRALGVKIALDDFGTGHSSLANVQRLPLDIVKIDRTFTQSTDAARDHALAKTIVDMARNLRLTTIGEGVETERQVSELSEMGCEYAQGFLFSEPLTTTSLTTMIDSDLARRKVHTQLRNDQPITTSGIPRDVELAKLLRPLIASPVATRDDTDSEPARL